MTSTYCLLFLISTVYFRISFFPYSNHNQFLAQLGQKEKERLINYFLYSNFTYGLLLWDFTTCKWIKKLEKFRKEIASLYWIMIRHITIIDSYYNHFDNILRLFNVLPNLAFTTSETMCDYDLQTWYIRVNIKDLRKLGNIRKVSKPHNDSLVPSPPAKMRTLLILAKIRQN